MTGLANLEAVLVKATVDGVARTSSIRSVSPAITMSEIAQRVHHVSACSYSKQVHAVFFIRDTVDFQLVLSQNISSNLTSFVP